MPRNIRGFFMREEAYGADDTIKALSPAERATGHAILNQMWKGAFP